jgi:hypothetical protein
MSLLLGWRIFSYDVSAFYGEHVATFRLEYVVRISLSMTHLTTTETKEAHQSALLSKHSSRQTNGAAGYL